MTDSPYDVVVVGAGIHGAGVAQACALNDLRTLIIEKTAIASGTSSRSSKLIHGGLRYLEGGHFKLVRECLRERQILLNIAPDIVHPVPFLIPLFRNSRRPSWQIRVGLTIYALLAGLNKLSTFKSLANDSPLVPPDLRKSELTHLFQYWDAQTDDRELTKRVVHSAQSLGADFLCPAELVHGEKTEGGYLLRISSNQNELNINTTYLVNAAGPWVNNVLNRITPAPRQLSIDLVQGAHIVIDKPPPQCCVYMEAPQDHRAVFVMPWKKHTLVGTTETLFEGDPEQTQPLQLEIDYLLAAYQHHFEGKVPRVIGSFSGLRVLPSTPGSLFHRSRELELLSDHPKCPRLVSIYGGKLTSYRIDCERIARTITKQLLPNHHYQSTEHLSLSH